MKRKLIAGLLIAVTLISLFTACSKGSSTSTTQSSTSTKSTSTSGKITLNTTLTIPAELNPDTLPNTNVTRISANELATMMNNNEKFVIVDTRDKDSYAQGHILGAINMPNYPPGQTFINQLIKLPLNEKIIFYCKWNGDNDAAAAAAAMPNLKDASGNVIGYQLSNVYALRAGWSWWSDLGYPTSVVEATLTNPRA